ncbi:MAG: hypothetical protein ACRENX_02190 [Candidatus Dormibacteria bacterium]
MRKLLVILLLASIAGAAFVSWGRNTPTSASFHTERSGRATTVMAVQAGHKKKHKKHKKHKVVKAAYPAACAAKADAATGSWSSAESEYAVAETEAVKNLGAVAVFASLGLDAGAVALDQVDGTTTTSDIATYNRDLTAGKQWFKGCT